MVRFLRRNAVARCVSFGRSPLQLSAHRVPRWENTVRAFLTLNVVLGEHRSLRNSGKTILRWESSSRSIPRLNVVLDERPSLHCSGKDILRRESSSRSIPQLNVVLDHRRSLRNSGKDILRWESSSKRFPHLNSTAIGNARSLCILLRREQMLWSAVNSTPSPQPGLLPPYDLLLQRPFRSAHSPKTVV